MVAILTDEASEAVRFLLYNGKGTQILEEDRHFRVVVPENEKMFQK